jgi:hypothetical protein
MKFLIVTLCMIATICAYHIKKNEHNLKIGKVEYTRIPVKYNFGKLDKSSIIPTEELLKRFAHKMDARYVPQKVLPRTKKKKTFLAT